MNLAAKVRQKMHKNKKTSESLLSSEFFFVFGLHYANVLSRWASVARSVLLEGTNVRVMLGRSPKYDKNGDVQKITSLCDRENLLLAQRAREILMNLISRYAPQSTP